MIESKCLDHLHSGVTVRIKHAWAKQIKGNLLWQAICESVTSRDTTRLSKWSKALDGAQTNRIISPHHITAARALITCAHIAMLDGESAAQLPDLLHALDPNTAVPDGLACQGASLEDQTWRTFVRRQIYQLKPEPPLSAQWAWDAVTRCSNPRPVTHSETVTALLVENGGATALLTLERLSDAEAGVLYPDPMMWFVNRDGGFQKAEQAAIAFVRESGLWGDDHKSDVRWRMVRQGSDEPLTVLNGGSAGGAFALALAKLFVA